MARGQLRPHGAGRVDRATFTPTMPAFSEGVQAFESNELPLPRSSNPREMDDFYLGYESAEAQAGIPEEQRLNKAHPGV